MKNKVSPIIRSKINLLIIFIVLISPIIFIYIMFKINVQKFPEIAKTYAEVKYGMKMNIIEVDSRFFPDTKCETYRLKVCQSLPFK